MDTKIDRYRHYTRQLLQKYAAYKPSHGEIERQIVFDTINDHYLLFTTGWDNDKRIHGVSIHFDIKDGKIWLQENRTEVDVAQKLVEMGVPREDIVLGLQPPYKRELTGYGVS